MIGLHFVSNTLYAILVKLDITTDSILRYCYVSVLLIPLLYIKIKITSFILSVLLILGVTMPALCLVGMNDI